MVILKTFFQLAVFLWIQFFINFVNLIRVTSKFVSANCECVNIYLFLNLAGESFLK